MVWRSNLLGLGPSITEAFPTDRCARSFNEIASPKLSSQSNTQVQKQKQLQLQLQSQRQSLSSSSPSPSPQQLQQKQKQKESKEPTYRTGLRVEPTIKPDLSHHTIPIESSHSAPIPSSILPPNRPPINNSYQHPNPAPTPPALDRDQLPPALVGMMDHIIGQVLIITILFKFFPQF